MRCKDSRVAFTPVDFAEDTDFERFVLDRLGTHRVRPAEPDIIHDVRGVSGGTTVMAGAAVAGAGLREELRRSLHPLGFGAAYKVLDMLVEHVLRANGTSAARLTFKEKKRALAKRPHVLPVPLDGHPDLWDRLSRLYVELQQGRHAVTHRRAQPTAAGDLEIYDGARRLIGTVASAEIEAFAAAVHAVAELVIDASDENRRVSIVAWHLNALRPRHGLPALPASDPNAGRRLLVMNLERLGDGRLRFDVDRARQAVDEQVPSVWDLQLHGDGRVFVGRWEDLPDTSATTVDFHPASPPKWLSEEIPST
jgi:hypothetical protein